MEAETMIRLAKNFCNVSFYDKDESKSHDAVVIDEGLQPWDFYATVADNDQGVWKALRLYRLWLTAVLRHGSADQHIPDTISRRRLANFWILLGLFYCKRKVEGGLHAQGTELLTTLECYQHTSGNADNTKTFIDMLSSVTSEVKGAQLLDVGDKVMHKFSPSKHIIFTPEIDDVHFRRIVERDDVEAGIRKVGVSHSKTNRDQNDRNVRATGLSATHPTPLHVLSSKTGRNVRTLHP